jgi:hypothetical protein
MFKGKNLRLYVGRTLILRIAFMGLPDPFHSSGHTLQDFYYSNILTDLSK